MCDQDTVHGSTEHPRKYGITRRQFSSMAASISLLTMLPPVANAQAVTESEVEITTPDGVCDAYFVHPAAGASAAVLMWPDIFGLRPRVSRDGQASRRIRLRRAGRESLLSRAARTDLRRR